MINGEIYEIRAQDGSSHIRIQCRESKVLLSPSSSAIALDEQGLNDLIAALYMARADLGKKERATLYARVPLSLKSQFLAKAQKEGLTQNAAIIAAVRRFLDPLVEYRPK